MTRFLKATLLSATMCACIGSTSANAATVIDANVGDVIRADFDLTGIQLPYVTELNVVVLSGTPTFSYEFYSGDLPGVVGSVSAVGFQGTPLTASGAVTFAILSQFASSLQSLRVALYYPEQCEGVTGACTPLLPGQLTKVSEIPVPAALPLFATGLAALGYLGRKRKKASASV
jgi:hypothetical protein